METILYNANPIEILADSMVIVQLIRKRTSFQYSPSKLIEAMNSMLCSNESEIYTSLTIEVKFPTAWAKHLISTLLMNDYLGLKLKKF